MSPEECKIEFYFKREQLEKMLLANPLAKGVIIRQEITQHKQPNGKIYNLVSITARVDKAAKKTRSKAAKTGKKPLKTTDNIEEIVEGCPFPPGCIQ